MLRPARPDETREARLVHPADEALAALWTERFTARAPLLQEDYATYLEKLSRWRALLAEYDVVQAYAAAPIIPLLCDVPFTAYEHGTLRDTPFEESALGRTTALGYREAAAVFVTNSDVLPTAERLGIPPERIVCLPHAVDSDRLLAFGRQHAQLAPPAEGPVSFLSPTRQDWRDADPSWTKGNDRAIRALALVRDEGLDCRLMLGEWGRDLEASKRLVAELDLEHMVEWVPPLRKTMLWKAYLQCHAVLDQFVLPAIGGVAFEAMALGRRVVTSLDLPTAERFFGETPPLLACSKPEEIAAAMAAVIEDPHDRTGLGERARDWFVRRHSADRIVDLQVDVYRRLVAAGRG
jgi:glycosyltransferase involved in cell wall biosynthesis